MLLFPAIDLMGGQVVRLRRGDPSAKTVYSNDPPSIARKWQHLGGDWLHVVDLDAAFTGSPHNLSHVAAICRAVTVPVQLGGGMRSVNAIRKALEAGVSRVVIGTRAAESLDFLREAITTFGCQHIAVGIDARNGFVAVKGWKEATPIRATVFAKQTAELAPSAIIYTDIATDGMLQGPNLHALRQIAAAVPVPVIASGGVSSRDDLRALEALGCLHGAIIGKALYDGLISGPLRPL